MASFGISSTVLTDKALQFTSKFFAAIHMELGVKTVTATEYHPQANAHVERFDTTMISRFSHFFAKRQEQSDTFVFIQTDA